MEEQPAGGTPSADQQQSEEETDAVTPSKVDDSDQPLTGTASHAHKPLSVLDYLLMLVLLALPVVNAVVFVWWSFSRKTDPGRRNFARAALIIAAVFVVVAVAVPRLLPDPATIGMDINQPVWWAQEEVTQASAYGLVPGDFTGHYTREITRTEMIELAVSVYEKASGVIPHPVAPNPFGDTDDVSVLKAATLGIVSFSADRDNSFRPLDTVSRQDMSVILLRTVAAAAPETGWDTGEHGQFADEGEIASWARGAVHFAFNHGIIFSHEGRIAPLMTLNREEAILCAKRAYELVARAD